MNEDELIREWEGYAYSIAARYYFPGASHDDVKQEALVGLLKGVRDYSPGLGPLGAFLHLCINRQLVTGLKFATREKHRMLSDTVREVVIESGPVPAIELCEDPCGELHDLIESRDQVRRLVVAINDLTELERQALIDVVLNGEAYGSIPGYSLKQIDNAVSRARRKLRAAA